MARACSLQCSSALIQPPHVPHWQPAIYNSTAEIFWPVWLFKRGTFLKPRTLVIPKCHFVDCTVQGIKETGKRREGRTCMGRRMGRRMGEVGWVKLKSCDAKIKQCMYRTLKNCSPCVTCGSKSYLAGVCIFTAGLWDLLMARFKVSFTKHWDAIRRSIKYLLYIQYYFVGDIKWTNFVNIAAVAFI